jgi:hypothetical protein
MSCADIRAADLDYPRRRLLLAPENTLRSYYTSYWINRTIEDIDIDDVSTMWVWVFVPHSDDDVRP